MANLPVVDIELDEEQDAELRKQLRDMLGPAIEDQKKREEKLARLKRAYKSKPEHPVKNFPWPNCSNIVIPIVAITVDNIVARLMKAFLGTPDLVEVEILSKSLESMEKDIRDWVNSFFSKSGARDTARSMFHDMSVDGDAFIKCTWASKERVINGYGADGQVYSHLKVDYEGPVWHAIPKADMGWPSGFDDWKKLPWFYERMRYTWIEIRQLIDQGYYRPEVKDKLRPGQAKMREDDAFRVVQEAQGQRRESTSRFFEHYEIWGKLEVPAKKDPGSSNADPNRELAVEEIIITYDYEHDIICRAIYNPHFTKARYIVRVPYLVQPHEIEGLGVAEMAEPFQQEASTAHNQTIDSSTAAIAGIAVVKAGSNIGPQQEVYPGARIVVDDVDDFKIEHFSMGNSTLPDAAVAAATWNEKRTGVSVYNMGMESPTVGSRATATGTTALISEGNQRFWVSIDDMREAIEELLYLTIGLVQQMAPSGVPLANDRMLVFPQGDVRESLGLSLKITSEKVNRDLEIQNFQLLMQVLNDYYGRVMQLGGMLLNPQFPPQQKQLAIQVMTAAQNLVKRFVERFDVQNIDELVPGISQAAQMIGGMVGSSPMAPAPGGSPEPLTELAPSGPPGLPPATGAV